MQISYYVMSNAKRHNKSNWKSCKQTFKMSELFPSELINQYKNTSSKLKKIQKIVFKYVFLIFKIHNNFLLYYSLLDVLLQMYPKSLRNLTYWH